MRDTNLYQPFLLAVPLLLLYKPKLAIQVIIGLMVVFFFTFRFTVLAQAGSVSIHNIDVVAASLTLFVTFLLLKRERIPLTHSTFWMLLLFGWGVLGILRSLGEWGFSAIHGARIEVVPMIIFFSILFIIRSEDDVVETLRRFAIIVFVGIVLNYIAFYYLGGIANTKFYSFDTRQASRFLIAEEALPVAFLLIGLLMVTVNGQLKLNIALIVAGLLFLLMTILGTQHRSVWIATLVGMILVWLRMLPNHRAFLLVASLVLSSLLIVLILLLLALNGLLGGEIRSFAEVNLAFLSGVQNDATGSWRLNIWQQYLIETYKSPLIGHGFGPELLIDFGSYKRRIQSHNAFVTYFYETGIIGIVILLTALFHWFREIQYYIRTELNPTYRMFAIGLQLSAVMSLCFGFFYRQHILIWVILGLGSVMAYQRYLPQKDAARAPADNLPYQTSMVHEQSI
ncbi:MAG: O-antigen ligase family protein [Chloroflexota bacterium]